MSYTGTGSNATVGHGLSSAPKVIIWKNRSQSNGWITFHDGVARFMTNPDPETDYLELHATTARVDLNTIMNDTAPTSSVFTVGTEAAVNNSGNNFIAYCFTDIQGYSKYSAYRGNGDTDGTFIYLGFEPKFFIVKPANGTTGGWTIYDNAREPFNDGSYPVLTANSSNAEATELSSAIDFHSTGVKIRGGSGSSDNNASGADYVYFAIAEKPFVTSSAVPSTAK